jgi:hypothetical protein
MFEAERCCVLFTVCIVSPEMLGLPRVLGRMRRGLGLPSHS